MRSKTRWSQATCEGRMKSSLHVGRPTQRRTCANRGSERYNGPSIAPCSLTAAVTSNSVFRARTDINLNLFEGDAPPPSAITMEYYPGAPEYKFTYSCHGGSITQEHQQWWISIYSRLHSAEKVSLVFVARDWTQIGSNVYARKTYQITTPEEIETTTMILRHTPQ